MSSAPRKVPAFLALACVLLAEVAPIPPAAAGNNLWLSDSAASTTAAGGNGTWGGRNPTEYTIGGVLSGSEGIERHFTQTLSVSCNLACRSVLT